jgi:heme exporter protein B
MKTASFIALVQRDLRIARRRPTEALLPMVFFVVACSLFPLGVGPESSTLRQIAPGIVWVCALVSAMLSLHTMYGTDFTDGSLEQMLLNEQLPVGIALAKALAHWCVTGVPLLLATPVLGLLFDMPILALTLVLGTPVLSLMGGVGAALTLGLRNGALLILLLVLPLCIPVLIFGAGAVSALDIGLSPLGHLYLMGALLLLALLGAPVATAAALRISI